MSCTKHFGLRAAPFGKDIGDDELWLPESKRAIAEALLEAIRDRHTGAVLVGEPGVGKTCLLRAVRHQLSPDAYRLTYCHNATLGRRDFYRQLCVAMGIESKATAAALFYAVSTRVEQLAAERIHPVFLLDEAHLLHPATLEHLHILSNYEWDSKPLLTMVLVGLPELWSALTLRKNRALWSRIHCRLDIGEASPADTNEYVRHRLERVGGQQDLFEGDALALLHEASRGRMRDIDRLATACLQYAAGRRLTRVDRHTLNHVVEAHHTVRR